ncbi:hypothetical protein L0Y59_02060 [Candidatus Uhrbacteria bacterium]|nr:hypothetical protein [Candidatus Uhrbacteria bacterium]
MKKTCCQPSWLIVAALAVGFLGLAVLVVMQSSLLKKITTVPTTEQIVTLPPTAPASSEEAVGTSPEGDTFGMRLLKTSSVEWDDMEVRVAHYCDGISNTLEFEMAQPSVSVCLGLNVLTLEYGDTVKVLDRRTATSYEESPILTIMEKTSSVGQYAAVQYAPYPCYVDEAYCGVGMPERSVTFAVNLATKSWRALENYPQTGTMDVEEGGRFFLHVPNACGGAGCEAVAIQGYDLVTDTLVNLTAERAADIANAKTVDGTRLSWWSKVQWTGEKLANAMLQNPDGTRKTIQITYPAQ